MHLNGKWGDAASRLYEIEFSSYMSMPGILYSREPILYTTRLTKLNKGQFFDWRCSAQNAIFDTENEYCS